jgi:hypothetical protein
MSAIFCQCRNSNILIEEFYVQIIRFRRMESETKKHYPLFCTLIDWNRVTWASIFLCLLVDSSSYIRLFSHLCNMTFRANCAVMKEHNFLGVRSTRLWLRT